MQSLALLVTISYYSIPSGMLGGASYMIIGMQVTATASARCAVQAAWENVETPWVYRHPMSRWS